MPSYDYYAEIKDRLDLLSIISQETGLKMKGHHLEECPFCHGHECFSIQEKRYKCFQCPASGDVFTFLETFHNFDKKEALKKAAVLAGIDLKKKELVKRTQYLNEEQISVIHKQLIKDKNRLAFFQKKYGLNLKTIRKYKLGYQNNHFVIPFELSNGKFTFKEHKGPQMKGNTALLYPGHILNDNNGKAPYIITAGEFKALLLIQNEFLAVASTCGEGTWKKEWSDKFKDQNIIVAYDADQPGLNGAQKVAANLKGKAKSVKIINWPKEMGEKDCKDVTDYFLKLKKNKKDFESLIKNAVEFEDDNCPFKHLGAEDFIISPKGIQYKIFVRDEEILKTACPIPVYIISRAIDIDTSTEELQIKFKRDNIWKELWVPKQILSDSKKILELSAHGFPVNSNNSKKVVEYIASFENKNIKLIPKTFVTRGYGWKNVQGQQVFILNESTDSDNKIKTQFLTEAGFERFVKALKPRGSLDLWLNAIRECLRYPFAAFAVFASLSAATLRLLGAPNFIVDYWGPTSTGKTTAEEMGASAWGNPQKESGGLIVSWDSTRVFLERIASFFNDMPIFPDDSQTVDDKTLTKILYMVANGVGKGRGNISGIRRPETWHTVCFSTGEKPLTDCTVFAGARARTISIYGSPFPNAGGAFINDIKNAIRENYGHAGPIFIKEISAYWQKSEDLNKMRNEYMRYQRVLSKQANSEVGDRMSHYFAVVKVTADIVSKLLNICDPTQAEEIIHKVFTSAIEENRGSSDMGTNAMQYILSWVFGNEKFFRSKADSEKYGTLADLNYIGIYPHKLKEILRKENWSEKVILRIWDERGWIKREDHSYSCPRTIIDDNNYCHRRFVIIPWKVVENFLNNKDDDE
jgi:putative DNA primase/helicase